MKNELLEIFSGVQITTASHQKKLRILKNYYEKLSEEAFFEEICEYLKIIFAKSSIPIKNQYVERLLDFFAQFVSLVTPANDKEDDFSAPVHTFLTRIITETLKYHNSCNDSLRYSSCLFVRLILQHIGCQTNLHNEILDMIQEAMLERTVDPKSSIRLQAVMALVRLQEPTNPDCPVIKAFLTLIVDGNASIRAEVVKTIAPYPASIQQIVSRLRDVDQNVRLMAFRRCADLVPKFFKIVERQRIMKCGLSETQPKLKKVFINNLLTKWLNAYNENYLVFLKALRLDANENDIVAAEDISKQVMSLLFSTVPINNVIENLPLDDDKVIPAQSLSNEAVNLWNITVNYLRAQENMDEYLDDVLPELTSFCIYIESIYNEKMKRNMDDWEQLRYQHILLNLLEIVEGYDFSDEVGRKHLYELVVKLIKEEDLQGKVKSKLICIASELAPKNDDFTSTVCHIISEIREPFTEVVTGGEVPNADTQLQMAALKVKIIKLGCELEDATDKQEFLKADSIKKTIDELKTKLKDYTVPQPTVEMVKVSKDDPKTICSCLDVLIALLMLPRVRSLTPSLVAVKDEFVVPLLESNVTEVNWRVINCLTLLCNLDRSLAEQYAKIICFPILTYRETVLSHKNALIVSIKSVCDLFLVYGAHIFGSTEDSANTTNLANQTRRRLYQNDDTDEGSALYPNRFQLEYIIEIMLDMLDDENSEIRHACVTAIYKLILNNFPVTPFLITRIFLKWYNPLTVTYPEDQLQQILGVLIETYTSTVGGAREVIAKAVIPILTSIASAPATSPLAEVDVDNLLHFLSAVTNSNETTNSVNTHLSMAHTFCYEMMKKKNAPIVHYLSKLLLHLDIPTENESSIKEVIFEVEILLQEKDLLDKGSKKAMTKFLEKLKSALEEEHSGTTSLETIHEERSNVNNDDSNTNNTSDNSNRNESDLENRGSPHKVSSDKTNSNQNEHESNVNNCCPTKDTSDKDDPRGKLDNGNEEPAGKKTKNKKRTRARPGRLRKNQSNSENNSIEIESDSTTESDCSSRTGKKLKVNVTQIDLERLLTGDPGKEFNRNSTENDRIEASESENRIHGEVDESTEENQRDNENCKTSKRVGSGETKNAKSRTRTGRNASIPVVLERRKGRNRDRPVDKTVNKTVNSQRSENESENSSDLETEFRRLSKRRKLQVLDLNEKRTTIGGRRSGLDRSIALPRIGKTQRPAGTRELDDTANTRKSVRKSRSKKSVARASNDFESDQDTILHTILHETSQMLEMNDISSFSSSNGSFSSQRSLRSNGSAVIPRSTKNATRVDTASNASPRRSARKIK